MPSLCLYASYVNGIGVPYYSKVFLTELKKNCSEVIYIYSNELDADSKTMLNEIGVAFLKVENKGFDFGQWKTALSSIDLNKYDQLFLVNDSSILFAPLNDVMKWFNNAPIDFGGLTESLHPKQHIQSYFLGFKKTVFNDLLSFFNSKTISSSIYEVISEFEIGLSQYLLSKNYTCAAYLSNDGYTGEFAPYYQCLKSHIAQGSPMIKKKIIFSSYRKDEVFTLARMNFDIHVDTYIDLIKKKQTVLLLSFDDLMRSEPNKMNAFERLKYVVVKTGILLYRKLNGNKR